MQKNHLENKYLSWAQEQEKKKDLPPNAIKTVREIKEMAKRLEHGCPFFLLCQKERTEILEKKALFYRQTKNYKKKKENFWSFASDSRINYFIYTVDSWKKLRSKSTEEYPQQIPFSLMHELLGGLTYYGALTEEDTGLNINERLCIDTNIRAIILEQEYLDWLAAMGKEDSFESKNAYADSLSDNEAYGLLEKYRMSTTYSLCVISAFVICDETTGPYPEHLTEKSRQRLSNFLTQLYGQDNFFLSGDIFSLGFIQKNVDKLISQAIEYPHSKGKFMQRINYLGIPFVVKHTHTSADIPLKDIQKFGMGSHDNICLSPKLHNFVGEHDEDGRMADVSLKKEGLDTILLTDLQREGAVCLELFHGWIDVSEIPSYKTEIVSAFCN